MAERTRIQPPRFELAAEHRARGLSWEAAGREVGRNVKTLREWAAALGMKKGAQLISWK